MLLPDSERDSCHINTFLRTSADAGTAAPALAGNEKFSDLTVRPSRES